MRFSLDPLDITSKIGLPWMPLEFMKINRRLRAEILAGTL